MSVKHRVAIIGSTGRGNYGHGLDTVWKEVPEAQVVGVADDNEAGLAAAVKRLGGDVRGFPDYRAMIETLKPTVVTIAPRWVDRHAEMAVFAAERGIHIYMEKPFCRTPTEGDAIIAACRNTGAKLALNHTTRWSPKLQVIREMIEQGRIGQVLELRGRGKEDRRGGGEDFWVLGSHILNLMYHFGGEPRWCSAIVEEGGRPVTRDHVKEGAEGLGPLAGDHISAMYGMDGGAKGYFATTRNAGAKGTRFGLHICGSQGIIELTTGAYPAASWLADPAWAPGKSGRKWEPITAAGETSQNGQALGNLWAVKDLLQAIEADRDPECSAAEGLITVEMICGAFESHRQGGARVAMPLQNRKNPLAML